MTAPPADRASGASAPPRRARVERRTRETSVTVALDLDGTGRADLDTMLDLFARHALVDLDVRAEGDTDVDLHHTVEDVGITLGQALDQALGRKEGIVRFASAAVPMDEALAEVALDVSGRPYLGYRVEFPGERIGEFETELVEAFLGGLVAGALRGERPPHRRGGVQGPRAGRADGRRPRPAGYRGAEHEGCALRTAFARRPACVRRIGRDGPRVASPLAAFPFLPREKLLPRRRARLPRCSLPPSFFRRLEGAGRPAPRGRPTALGGLRVCFRSAYTRLTVFGRGPTSGRA